MTMNLWDVAKVDDGGKRDKFISRFFGIFSEEIAGLYFGCPFSKYKNLGRPTIKKDNVSSTLDFTLQDKMTNKIYICEMKCEMQYQKFKRFELKSIEQVESHVKQKWHKRAFIWFLDIANNKNAYKVEIKEENRRKEIEIDGIILLWGKTDNEKIKEIQNKFDIHDILSLEEMVNTMINNDYAPYFEYIEERREWVNKFLDGITE